MRLNAYYYSYSVKNGKLKSMSLEFFKTEYGSEENKLFSFETIVILKMFNGLNLTIMPAHAYSAR